MTDKLYEKICHELSQMNFGGVVQFFYVNEPFLDPNILNRLDLLRKAAPKCCIHITSNGELLGKNSTDIASRVEEALVAGATVVNLNAYTENRIDLYRDAANHLVGKKILGRTEIKEPKSMWSHYSGTAKLVCWHDMTNPKGLHDWTSKEVHERAEKFLGKKSMGHCARPHRHIVVRCDGHVPLCCAVSPDTKETFGDVNTKTLLGIWEHKGLYAYRRALQDKKRIGTCANCMESGGAYSWAVRLVKAADEK
jgi:MoaA/NifB/PqqE/SkfB family radical SAM enzyme